MLRLKITKNTHNIKIYIFLNFPVYFLHIQILQVQKVLIKIRDLNIFEKDIQKVMIKSNMKIK